MQVDPLATIDHSATPYHYARNNPSNGNDPSGLYMPQTRSDAFWGRMDAQMNGTYWNMSYDDRFEMFGGGGAYMSPVYTSWYGQRPSYANFWMHLFNASGPGRTDYRNTGNYFQETGSDETDQLHLSSFIYYKDQNGNPIVLDNGISGQGYFNWGPATFKIKSSASQGTAEASLYPKEFAYGNFLLNTGSTLVGAGELAINGMRRYPNGPQALARGASNLGLRIGTQKMAGYLSKLAEGSKSLGTKLGWAGAVLGTADYIENFDEKNGYDHASYWIGTGVFLLTVLNPATAVVGLVYGGAQVASYLYNGKSAEENIGTALGY